MSVEKSSKDKTCRPMGFFTRIRAVEVVLGRLKNTNIRPTMDFTFLSKAFGALSAPILEQMNQEVALPQQELASPHDEGMPD